MIKNTLELNNELKNYVNIKMKIQRLIKNGDLFPLKKGLYETEKNVNPFYLASQIYGPSYISFDTALSFYNLIPERVYLITSATLNKRKKKEFNNSFGTYLYRDVPENVYPYGINQVIENNYTYYIACPEKAICDKLYNYPKVNTIKDMKELLFDDLRFDEDVFKKLNINLLIELASMYKTENHYALIKFLKRNF